MLITSKSGKTSLAKDKIAVVRCEFCCVIREVHFLSNYKKTHHLCRSCSTTKQLTGKTYSSEHRKAISRSIRKQGWRLQSGYRQVIVDEYHPRTKPRKNGRYIMEHILVMEEQLGRFLEEHEIVHHIDENRLNNDPQNLYLCSGSTATESRQMHNAVHQSAEMLTIELFKKGLVEFKDGKYVMASALATLAAQVL
jgi:hypothetical protein